MDKISKHFTVPNVTFILVGVFTVAIAISAVGNLQGNYVKMRRLDIAKTENDRLEIENGNLQLQQAYFRTDEFLELETRMKLNKVQPGEHLVLLPKPIEAQEIRSTIDTMAPQTDSRSNFEKWTGFLFGY